MTTLSHTTAGDRTAERSNLWKGAVLTAAAALLFPRLNAVMYEHEKIWQLDREAVVLAPTVVVVSLLVSAGIGTAAWRGNGNRPAPVSLACGLLSVLGIAAFWVSAPIMFGGLAVTLGLEGLRRAPERGRRGLAAAGTALGATGAVVGALIWLLGV